MLEERDGRGDSIYSSLDFQAWSFNIDETEVEINYINSMSPKRNDLKEVQFNNSPDKIVELGGDRTSSVEIIETE
jgi:hypothetical protein